MYKEKGTIHEMGEIKSGESAKGPWARQQVIIDIPLGPSVEARWCFTAGTKMIDNIKDFKAGDEVEVGFMIKAREYNGKWYTDLEIIFLESQRTTKIIRGETKPEAPKPVEPAFDPTPADQDPDLPF